MTFLADESVAAIIVTRLRADGWPVVSVQESYSGTDDPDVLTLAVAAGSVLLTEDKDFGDLVYRDQLPHCGVVLIRLGDIARALRAEIVSRAVGRHQADLPEAFTVVTPGGVRVRRP